MTSPSLKRIERAFPEGSADLRVLDGASPVRRLAVLVRQRLSEARGEGIRRVESVNVPAGDVSALEWLRTQEAGSRSYWSGRDDGFEVAAVGVADSVSSAAGEDLDALQERLALLSSEARYYGGMRFDTDREADDSWTAFGDHRFVLPRFELRREGGEEAVLSCNLLLPGDAGRVEEIAREIEALQPPDGSFEGRIEAPTGRVDTPDLAGWRSNIERALSAFGEGSLKKVVLARRADLTFDDDLDPLLLIEKLKARTPGCFHFFFEPEEGAAFLGASPERLYRREERSVKSEAVAGTRPRGESAADDEDLRVELLGSEKDRAEHRFVRVGIDESLRPLCDGLEIEEGVSEMKLASRRHLVSRVRARLRDGVTDAEVLGALHPTPAVGGYPKERALEDIRALEPFDRGWWAGPVGWVGAYAAEFAVGIRSGLVRGRTLALFSGAGIVSGSKPEEEWAEIEQKISDFTRVFGLEPAHARG